MFLKVKYLTPDIEQLKGNNEFLENPEVLETLRSYYESHVTHHKIDNDVFVAVTKEGRCQVEEGAEENYESLQYIDYARSTIFTFNVKTG